MFWAKVLASLILIVFGAAASLWGIGKLVERLATGHRWPFTILLATIGALPEFCIALLANAKGMGLIAFGTPLGSCAINLLLLGGLAAVIHPTKPSEPFPSRVAWGVALAALFLLLVACIGRYQSALGFYTISRWGGLLLILAFALFVLLTSGLKLSARQPTTRNPSPRARLIWPFTFLIVGIALVFCGATLAASTAFSYIVATGASQYMLGVLVLAPVAALPEATAVVFLACHRQTVDAFEDLLHSSVANLLFVIGLVALVHPMPAYTALPFDIAVILLGVLLQLGAIALGKGKRISRGEGIVLMLVYCLFVAFVLLRQEDYSNLFF